MAKTLYYNPVTEEMEFVNNPSPLRENLGQRFFAAKGIPGGWWGDWELNYKDQMTFEEYKKALDIDKNPSGLEKAEGGRINKKPGGIVEPGVTNYGKIKAAPWMDAVANKIIDYNVDKDARVFISRTERVAGQTERGTALEGFLDQNQAIKFANATAKQIEWLSEKSGVSKTIIKNAQTKYNAIPASQRRNFSLTENQLKWQLERVDLQKKILARVNQGDTSIKQIAKNLKLSVAKVDAAAGRLYNNIYAEKLKINSPNLKPTSVYLPKTTEGLNGILETLWEVDGFEGPEGRTWYKLIRDAKESNRITEEQFKTATGNVRNFFRMKNEIQAKYPDIILNLDHSLSFGALTGIGAEGEKFLTGVPSTETFNKGIKQVIDNKYATTLENIRAGEAGALEQKVAIEKLAKNLNIDIGEVSKTGKKVISYGEKDIVSGKTSIPTAIIESLQEQTELAKKLKHGVDPKLLDGTGLMAYFKKHKKLPPFSKLQISKVSKLVEKVAKALKCDGKAKGGRIGFAGGSGVLACIDAKWERDPKGFWRATANIVSKGLDTIWKYASPLFFPASQIAMGRLESFKHPTEPEMWWNIMLASDAVKRWGLNKATLSQLKNASWATRSRIIGDLILKFPGDKILTQAAKVARPLIVATETLSSIKGIKTELDLVKEYAEKNNVDYNKAQAAYYMSGSAFKPRWEGDKSFRSFISSKLPIIPFLNVALQAKQDPDFQELGREVFKYIKENKKEPIKKEVIEKGELPHGTGPENWAINIKEQMDKKQIAENQPIGVNRYMQLIK